MCADWRRREIPFAYSDTHTDTDSASVFEYVFKYVFEFEFEFVFESVSEYGIQPYNLHTPVLRPYAVHAFAYACMRLHASACAVYACMRLHALYTPVWTRARVSAGNADIISPPTAILKPRTRRNQEKLRIYDKKLLNI